MADRPKVAIIMGSDSDWPVMETCYKTLQDLEIPVAVEVISAHRTPERLRDFVLSADDQNIAVFIAAAGMAAALPGAVASWTSRPVIGVPLASGALQGVDSLLSIVQMPPGVPVATVAVGAPGAKNAALLAVQMLALFDAEIAQVLKKYKRKQAKLVDEKNQTLQGRLGLV